MDISNILSLPTVVKDALLAALLAPGGIGSGTATVTIPPKPTAKRTSRKAFKKAAPKPKATKKAAAKPRAAVDTSTIVHAVASTDGSLAAVAKAAGWAKPKAAAALKAAVKTGAIRMAGKLRFARYGVSHEQAQARSEAAQGKAPSNGVAVQAAN